MLSPSDSFAPDRRVGVRSGVKRFRLPKGCKPVKVLAGPSFEALGGGVYSVKMNIGEIFVLAYR